MKALCKFARWRIRAGAALAVPAALFFVFLLAFVAAVAGAQGQPLETGEELLVSRAAQGQHGGRLVVALRSEPRTLNPVLAADSPSREVIRRMMADLVHINRASQRTEPALAKSWRASKDGLRYTLKLRRGLRFSDGQPLTADDVVFTFQVYLDEKVHSPQRDLLLVGGKPIVVRKVDAQTVVFELSQPYAPAERLFDSIAILPRHLLKTVFDEGKFAQAWGLNAPVHQIAGMGPFRLKEYAAGQRIVLERNPYYWKVDQQKRRLPYLDEIVFLIVPNEDAQVIRFQAAETDVISRMSAKNYSVLSRGAQSRYRLMDLGPSLEYLFLFFNLNDLSAKNLPEIARKQAWFRDVRFRQAVSAAIDREGIVRLVFEGRATPLAAHVTPGNKLWVNGGVAEPAQSVERARKLLQEAGFSWRADGKLVDGNGQAVEFSIVTSSSNAARTQIGTIIQDDLKKLGISVNVLPMESRSVLDRIFNTHEYEASLAGLASGDVDPTSEMNVWRLAGATHLWNLGQEEQAGWEGEIDRLMGQQLTTLDAKRRKRLYDRVQQLVAENLPLICLVSPNILVGAHSKVGNFQPAIIESYTLWNADEIYVVFDGASARR